MVSESMLHDLTCGGLLPRVTGLPSGVSITRIISTGICSRIDHISVEAQSGVHHISLPYVVSYPFIL